MKKILMAAALSGLTVGIYAMGTATPFVGVIQKASATKVVMVPDNNEFNTVLIASGPVQGKINDVDGQKACISLGKIKLINTLKKKKVVQSEAHLYLRFGTPPLTVTSLNNNVRKYDHANFPFDIKEDLLYFGKVTSSRQFQMKGVLTAKVKQNGTSSSEVYDASLKFSMPAFEKRPAMNYEIQFVGKVHPVPMPSPGETPCY